MNNTNMSRKSSKDKNSRDSSSHDINIKKD